MCQLTVLQELDRLQFSVSALAQLCGMPGSFERENADNIQRGICARLKWCREQVERRQFLGTDLNKTETAP